MSIQQITERETALANTLRMTTEALTLVTKERDRLSALADKWNLECDDMREDNKRLAAELKSLRDSGVELPEPEVFYRSDWVGRVHVEAGNFTESQLRDYGDRRAMAERERCALVCESRSTPGTGSVAILLGAAEEIRKGEK